MLAELAAAIAMVFAAAPADPPGVTPTVTIPVTFHPVVPFPTDPLEALRQSWLDEGATAREADRIVQIAKGPTNLCEHGESTGDPTAENRWGYRGLTQISPDYHDDLIALGIIDHPDDLFDPYVNGRAAWWLYAEAYGSRGQGWGGWSCRDTRWGRHG